MTADAFKGKILGDVPGVSAMSDSPSGCTHRLACAHAMRPGATRRHACVDARRGSARRSTSADARPGRGAASSMSSTWILQYPKVTTADGYIETLHNL